MTHLPKYFQSYRVSEDDDEFYSEDAEYGLGLFDGSGDGYGECNGDGISRGIGFQQGSSEGGVGTFDGCGFGGTDTADGDGYTSGDGSADVRIVSNPEVILFLPWTPEKILHAYAYVNATSKEEKDCILGLMELSST